MSDLDDYRALLTRTNVDFEVAPVETEYTRIVVKASARAETNANTGYSDFEVRMIFDEHGALLEFGIWE